MRVRPLFLNRRFLLSRFIARMRFCKNWGLSSNTVAVEKYRVRRRARRDFGYDETRYAERARRIVRARNPSAKSTLSALHAGALFAALRSVPMGADLNWKERASLTMGTGPGYLPYRTYSNKRVANA